MMSLREVFIQNLKYYRKLKGLRQIDLALEINKNTNYINSIENSKYFPSPETIEQIAQILGIEAMQLFDKNAPKPPQAHKADTNAIKAKLEADVIRCIELAFSERKDF